MNIVSQTSNTSMEKPRNKVRVNKVVRLQAMKVYGGVHA